MRGILFIVLFAAGEPQKTGVAEAVADVSRHSQWMATRAATSIGATLRVVASPAVDKPVEEKSVVSVELDFKVMRMSRTARYAIAPFFARSDRGNVTFNSLSDPLALQPLKKPEGRVDFRYPLRREWRSGKLARPIVVWFAVIEQTNVGLKTLVEVGPFPLE